MDKKLLSCVITESQEGTVNKLAKIHRRSKSSLVKILLEKEAEKNDLVW
jgi:hypothetical protein